MSRPLPSQGRPRIAPAQGLTPLGTPDHSRRASAAITTIALHLIGVSIVSKSGPGFSTHRSSGSSPLISGAYPPILSLLYSWGRPASATCSSSPAFAATSPPRPSWRLEAPFDPPQDPPPSRPGGGKPCAPTHASRHGRSGNGIALTRHSGIQCCDCYNTGYMQHGLLTSDDRCRPMKSWQTLVHVNTTSYGAIPAASPALSRCASRLRLRCDQAQHTNLRGERPGNDDLHGVEWRLERTHASTREAGFRPSEAGKRCCATAHL